MEPVRGGGGGEALRAKLKQQQEISLAITLVAPKEEVALRDVERLLGKAIKREEIDGYVPKLEKVGRGARKVVDTKKKTDGAFGRKKSKLSTTKKRKTTKRDGFKNFDSKPKKEKPKKKRG